jgi:hypothetical protein
MEAAKTTTNEAVKSRPPMNPENSSNQTQKTNEDLNKEKFQMNSLELQDEDAEAKTPLIVKRHYTNLPSIKIDTAPKQEQKSINIDSDNNTYDSESNLTPDIDTRNNKKSSFVYLTVPGHAEIDTSRLSARTPKSKIVITKSQSLRRILEEREQLSSPSSKSSPHRNQCVKQISSTNSVLSVLSGQFAFSSKSPAGFVSFERSNITNVNNKRLMINVGGTRFETYASTLKLIPESRLANLTETNSDYDPIKNEYFFDRDPSSFLAILNFYRTGSLHAPMDLCGNVFHQELNFWGISETSIQPCCWTSYSEKRNCDEILKHLMDHIEEENELDDEGMEPTLDQMPLFARLRQRANMDASVRQKSCMQKLLYNVRRKYKPAIWRFYDDCKSSMAATVSKTI